MERSTNYILIFATIVCFVCSIFVSGTAVALKEKQELNKKIDMQKKVLLVAGVIAPGEKVADSAIPGLFGKNIETKIVDLKSGEYTKTDTSTYDQLKATKDPNLSIKVTSKGAKAAGVSQRVKESLVYIAKKDRRLILPIEGKGLWSTLYGFLALNSDLNTVEGIIFYQHGETPGLGGEIENPRWTGLWPGKKLFDGKGQPAIKVIKGQAKAGDPHEIDGLSGATITGRGVSNLVRYWMGDECFGKYLKKMSSTQTGQLKGGVR